MSDSDASRIGEQPYAQSVTLPESANLENDAPLESQEAQGVLVDSDTVLGATSPSIQQMLQIVQTQGEQLQRIEAMLSRRSLTSTDLVNLNHHFTRNFLPNDTAIQKNIIATWRLRTSRRIGHAELNECGFRVFSQNDEDGILLRLFTHIGSTNRYAVEIGSNCSGSEVGIPENLSTNLFINHGWHGAIIEMDATECDRMRYFFARDHATRHFHWERDGVNTYFSPQVIQREVNPANINEILLSVSDEREPDLMIVDIDGGDYSVVQGATVMRPRVLVVEFEKRFRERHSVFQPNRTHFSQRWQQSGSVSLTAWVKLLGARGYCLCAIGSCGFNAFFVRNDVAARKLSSLTATAAFDSHPVFSKIEEEFWLTPDETWQEA